MNQIDRDFIDTTFQRLVLGGERKFGIEISVEDYQYALKRTEELLISKNEVLQSSLFEARLRLALHLSPVDAIRYNSQNPKPRFRVILDYLNNEFGRKGPGIELLARELSMLLDALDEIRERNTSGYLEDFLSKQNYCCAHCKVNFKSDPHTLTIKDVFKPYYEAPETFFSPEVDHIEPISTFGTNDLLNLQVLCRLCNAGKASGLGINVLQEKKFAADKIDQVPKYFRMQMLYYVLARDKSQCQKCQKSDTELTIRLVRSRGGYVRTNLQTICVACL